MGASVGAAATLRKRRKNAHVISIVVSYKLRVKCFRSDCLCIVLPRPALFCSLLFEYWAVLGILLCGEIELNIGPNTKVEAMMESVLRELNTIKDHPTQFDTSLGEIKVKLLGLDEVPPLARKNEAALATMQQDVQALHSVVNHH